MSSHREAPEISKDPVADNTDVYAFVSPDRPDTVTLIANFIPLQLPYGGPNFTSSATTCSTRSTSPTAATRKPTSVPVPVQDQGPQPEHVPLQHRARSPRSTARTGTGRSSTRSPGSTRQRAGRSLGRGLRGARRSTSGCAAPRTTRTFTAAGRARRCPAAGGSSPASAPRASSSTSGSIFDLGTLRPFQNLHLIPSAAAVGVNGTQGLNVHTIAIQVPMSRPDPGRARPDRRRWTRLGHRRVGLGQPARRRRVFDATAGASRRHRPVPAGVPARQPAVQRGHRADGAEGPVERAAAAGDARSPSTSPSRSWPGCCRCSTRACSRTSPAYTSRPGGPAGDPADRASRPASSPASRTSPAPRRPTCSG